MFAFVYGERKDGRGGEFVGEKCFSEKIDCSVGFRRRKAFAVMDEGCKEE